MDPLNGGYALNFALGSLLVPLLGLLAYRLKVVDITGYVAGILIGILVFWYGGWTWFLQILYFILVASIFTRFKYETKYLQGVAQEKGGARPWKNVVANGSAAALAAVMSWFTGNVLFYAFFIGSVSSMAADTLATEVGLTSKTPPRLITNLRTLVQAGTSGGVTPIGTFAAFAAAFASGVLGFFVASSIGWSYLDLLAIASMSGLAGTIFDSFMGATLQGHFRCSECGRKTERRVHCGERTLLQSGISNIDNDLVNLSSSIFGGFFAVLIAVLI